MCEYMFGWDICGFICSVEHTLNFHSLSECALLIARVHDFNVLNMFEHSCNSSILVKLCVDPSNTNNASEIDLSIVPYRPMTLVGKTNNKFTISYANQICTIHAV